jgi:hypothetical protein
MINKHLPLFKVAAGESSQKEVRLRVGVNFFCLLSLSYQQGLEFRPEMGKDFSRHPSTAIASLRR